MPSNDLTVASTTDSQAEVNAAAGIVEEATGEVAESGAETEAESQAAPESSEEEHEEAKEHTSKRSQKIKRLAGKLTETERERDEWREKFEQLSQGRQEQPKPDTARVDPYVYPVPKPKAADYVNPQDFVEVLTEWKVDEREYKAALKAQAEEQQVAQNEIRDSYGVQLAEAKAEFPDFEQVVGRSDLKIWPEVETALRLHEHGAELAYWLAKNPEVTDKLAQMPPARAVAELGAIASSLNHSATPAPRKRIEPIKPVGGGTTKTAIDNPDQLSYQDWKKWYKANGGRR